MTAAEFKKKWAKVSAKESAAYQSHFNDLCRLLKVPPPLEADPKGEFFCFQKHVAKDAELFVAPEPGEATVAPSATTRPSPQAPRPSSSSP